MRASATFDFQHYHFTDQHFRRDVAVVKSWATSTRAPTVGIVSIRCSSLPSRDQDSIRVRDVSKVITVTVGVADCLPVHDLAAVPVRQASETRAGFRTVQSPYVKDL